MGQRLGRTVGRAGTRRTAGPPPWVAGLFGLAQTEHQRGPKVRRGDVRAAIFDMLKDEPMNGYQLISPDRRAHAGAPGSPARARSTRPSQQLEDEGLVEADDERGRRTLRLTDEGRATSRRTPTSWRRSGGRSRQRDESGGRSSRPSSPRSVRW